jgi:hypothetical protein
MDPQAIDLSAGLVPAPAPPPTPPPTSGGAIDLSAGLMPVTQSANAALPIQPATPPPAPPPPDTTGLLGRIGNLLGDVTGMGPEAMEAKKGFVKGAMQTVGGGLQLLNKDNGAYDPQGAQAYTAAHPGTSPEDAIAATMKPGDPQGHIHAIGAAANWLKQHSQTHNIWQQLGAGGEGLAEFLVPGLGEESAVKDAAELPTYGEKLQEAGKTAAFLEKTPMGQKLAHLAAIGARTIKAAITKAPVMAAEGGVGAGAQSYLKSGGDEEEAAKAAKIGAIGGGVLGASAEGVAGLWEAKKYAAAIALARLARPSLTVDAIGDLAREITAVRMGETNATRTTAPPPKAGEPDAFTFDIEGTATKPSVEGHIGQDARKVQAGTVVKAGKGSPSGIPDFNAEDFEPTRTSADGTTSASYNPNRLQFDAQGKPTYTPPSQYENVGRDAAGNPSYPDAAGDTTDPAIEDGEQGSHREPVFNYLPESRPGSGGPARDVASGGGRLLTKDPKVAGAHLGSLEEIINGEDFDQMPPERQQQLLALRDDIKSQLAEYRQWGKTNGRIPANFQPVDADAAIRGSGNLAEAGEQIAAPAKEVYEHANNVSGGRWQALKDHIDQLGEDLAKEPYQEGRDKIWQKIARARSSMEDILRDPKSGFDNDDVTQAVRNFRTSYILKDAHEAIKPIYAVESKDGSVTGAYRGINGPMVAQRFDSFLKANPDAVELMGQDRVNTIKRIMDANETMASRKRFGGAVMNVAAALAGFHFGGLTGALERGATSIAVRHVLDSAIANPRITKNLLFAIDSGARPEAYAPHVAKMIMTSARRLVPPTATITARKEGEQ